VIVDGLHTDEIILTHNFTSAEQWLVFIATIITAFSFYAVVVVLWKLHKKRGLDIVLIKVSALCFLIYRSSIAFRLKAATSAEYIFLPTDSWHKLSNVFMLIEYCSLIIFLARIQEQLVGYILAIGISIIIILQEKDSFSYQYALIPMLFNNLVLIGSSALYDKPGSFNPTMVMYGAFWYMVSVVGFLLTFSETLDYYFFFDDLFMVATCFSMFYSWQSFQVSADPKKPAPTVDLIDTPRALVEIVREIYDDFKSWRDEVRAIVAKRRLEIKFS